MGTLNILSNDLAGLELVDYLSNTFRFVLWSLVLIYDDSIAAVIAVFDGRYAKGVQFTTAVSKLIAVIA
jgi:hypothetical protein